MRALKVLGVIALVLVVLVLGVLILASTKPAIFTVQRSLTVAAEPEQVLTHVRDFHRWKDWSPYEKLDPNLKRTFSGSDKDVGAIYEWEGNDKAGKGRMEVVESVPTKVAINLDFFQPFECHGNLAEFTAVPDGKSTKVTWKMTGPNLFVGKVMSVFMDMDKMVGQDFEVGLANLKGLAEKEGKLGGKSEDEPEGKKVVPLEKPDAEPTEGGSREEAPEKAEKTE